MLDIRQLRTDPQGVAGNLARRGYSLDLAQFTALETRRKEAQVAVDALRNERNTRSKAIGQAKAQGQRVTAEATPHHLLLTDEACRSYDTNYKMSPPLRTAADVLAVIEGRPPDHPVPAPR